MDESENSTLKASVPLTEKKNDTAPKPSEVSSDGEDLSNEVGQEAPMRPQPVETFVEVLPTTADGTEHVIRIIRYGKSDARPKVYIQAGLHADELPGMLVLRELHEELASAAERGDIVGQVVLVPVANPIGLAQEKGGYMQGRVEQSSDRNFNRGFPNLAALARRRIVGKFDSDNAEKNVAKIRKAMMTALDAIEPTDTFEAQQIVLMKAACDADIVLDLHADNEALMHMYTRPDFWPEAEDLAAELDVRAILLSEESGGEPFDESCSAPWFALAEKQPDAAIPKACFSATVELRSNNDVDFRDAKRDARGLMRFMMRRGVLLGDPGVMPRLLCEATALNAMQQVRSPITGLVIYKLRLGDSVRKGDIIAEIVPIEGETVEVLATTDGVLFARHDQTWAWDNKVIAKVAGTEPLPERVGNLLTD